jgi:hypothetical protein
MTPRIFALCALFAGVATVAQAQAPGSFTIKCSPSLVVYQFSATQSIWTYTCTTDAVINGVPITGLTFSQTAQGTAIARDAWGVIVGSLANSDKVFFQFNVAAHNTSSVTNAGILSYKIVGGTGIANGISGSGTCSGTGVQGGGSESTCVGAYATR